MAKKKKAEEKRLRKAEKKNSQASNQLAVTDGVADPVSTSDENANAGEGS